MCCRPLCRMCDQSMSSFGLESNDVSGFRRSEFEFFFGAMEGSPWRSIYILVLTPNDHAQISTIPSHTHMPTHPTNNHRITVHTSIACRGNVPPGRVCSLPPHRQYPRAEPSSSSPSKLTAHSQISLRQPAQDTTTPPCRHLTPTNTVAPAP